MSIRHLVCSVGLACGFIAFGINAQDDSAKAIDKIFEDWNKPDSPGAAVAVIRDGEVVFAKGYGIANLEYGIPITPDTVFHVASVSKQFTAMALVLLEQDGKLSLEDDIHKFLPELPDYGAKITVRNLLQHTSGIRDQWQTLGLAGWRLDDVITQKQILRMLFRQKELNFTPGSEHLYSNGGYTLAAEIVARVSGKSFPEFCRERIFVPLGMKTTHFHDDHRHVVRNRAYSYSRAKDGYEASPLNYSNAGATSLFTTAPDLARWLDNFRAPGIGGPAAIARLQEQCVLSSGRDIPYALGLSIGKHRGLKVLSHGGGDAGYRSYVAWFPEPKLGVAVVGNAAHFNSAQAANRVAAVFAGAAMTAEDAGNPAGRKYITVDPAALEKFAGFYRVGSGMIIEVEKTGAALLVGPVGQGKTEAKPVAANRFAIERANVELEFNAEPGGRMAVKVTESGGAVFGERITLAKFDPADLPAYAGVYWSEELETQYTMLVKDGKLIADHARHGEITLQPVGKDRFRGASWFLSEIEFTRDDSGRISGAKIGGGRVRAVRFTRRP